ncbi:hypothetical protein BDR03DRAFT_826279, partial [Suillus americanus]
WSESDEMVLINYIITNKSKGGDGLNFNKTFWNDAHTEMVQQPVLQGAPKTAEACQSKWWLLAVLISTFQICKVYQVIHKIANASGISYSAELGANIGCESEMIWADYV